jgi:hypothetical protein
MVQEGFLRYYITVRENGTSHTYPSGNEGLPTDWDFYDQQPYVVRVVNPFSPVCLFDAGKDGDFVYGNYRFLIMPSRNPGESVLTMRVRNLRRVENHYAARFFFAEKIKGRYPDLALCSKIVLYGYSLTSEPQVIQVGLINDLGLTYAGTLAIQPGPGEYSIPLKNLTLVKTAILPNTYPTFLPFYFKPETEGLFDISRSESVQVSIGPGITENEYDKIHGVAIEKIYLK